MYSTLALVHVLFQVETCDPRLGASPPPSALRAGGLACRVMPGKAGEVLVSRVVKGSIMTRAGTVILKKMTSIFFLDKVTVQREFRKPLKMVAII